jgi:hypothetical protein
MSLEGSQCARHALRVITISEEKRWSDVLLYWDEERCMFQPCKEDTRPGSCPTEISSEQCPSPIALPRYIGRSTFHPAQYHGQDLYPRSLIFVL